ncbi:hypothetical protein GCM10023235_11640 [Kitasatospora terrestris]|uniref:Uncharacterized protein n=1 Tax=Kitasatospora terrestris TaxID=258051 RepID=A0ABP9DB44_9ACTN
MEEELRALRLPVPGHVDGELGARQIPIEAEGLQAGGDPPVVEGRPGRGPADERQQERRAEDEGE